MKLSEFKEEIKLSNTVKNVMCKTLDKCIEICLLSICILCTYFLASNPIIFYIGITIFKTSLMYIAICIIFGFIFNKLINEL